VRGSIRDAALVTTFSESEPYQQTRRRCSALVENDPAAHGGSWYVYIYEGCAVGPGPYGLLMIPGEGPQTV
jgi:hypothetical protein